MREKGSGEALALKSYFLPTNPMGRGSVHSIHSSYSHLRLKIPNQSLLKETGPRLWTTTTTTRTRTKPQGRRNRDDEDDNDSNNDDDDDNKDDNKDNHDDNKENNNYDNNNI